MTNLIKVDQSNILIINALSELATIQGNLEKALELMQEVASNESSN